MAISKHPLTGEQSSPGMVSHGTPPLPYKPYNRYLQLVDLELIALVREGIPAALLKELANDLRIPLKLLGKMLNVPQATLKRIGSHNKLLQPGLSERVLELIRIFNLVTDAATDSGHPDALDAGPWLGTWLQTPVPALGGEIPGNLLDTMTGVKLVTRVLNQGLHGVYS